MRVKLRHLVSAGSLTAGAALLGHYTGEQECQPCHLVLESARSSSLWSEVTPVVTLIQIALPEQRALWERRSGSKPHKRPLPAVPASLEEEKCTS